MLQKNDKITYPGLIAAWSAKGKSNDDADRTVLRDLTGNGHDITLNNFAFSEMSGYGGYVYKNFSYPWFTGDTSIIDVKRINHGFTVTFSKLVDSAFLYRPSFVFNEKPLRLKVNGISDNIGIYVKYDNNKQALVNGINIIQFENIENKSLSFCTSTLFEGANVRVEMLPEYPDALVFDGVDDYGNCDMINANLFKENFTFICKREYVSEPAPGHLMTTANCRAASLNASVFTFEGFLNYPYISVYSNGGLTYDKAPVDYSLNTTFLTPTNYNGHTFKHSGENNYEDNARINIGRLLKGDRYANMAFYSAYLFDRSLDEQEIKAFIRKYIDADYLLPSEQTTE